MTCSSPLAELRYSQLGWKNRHDKKSELYKHTLEPINYSDICGMEW